jgi:hypothetical protein
MPDKYVAEFIETTFGDDFYEVYDALDSLTQKGARDPKTGELWFWAVYDKFIL